jgi:hypothetical protein
MRWAGHFSLAALLTLPAIGFVWQGRRAQDRRHTPEQGRAPSRAVADQDEQPPRRLETVTWDSVKHELTWVISNREANSGKLYLPGPTENYQISLDDATMSYEGETRRFSRQEASNVHVLMDLIAKYAVDSTVWWEDGQGDPVNGPEEKQQSAPPKAQPPADDDNNEVAILRVAAGARPAVEAEIQCLERRLADLKRIERRLASAELSKD